MSGPTDDMPLGEVRDWLRERIRDGEVCPCCNRWGKVYHRKLNRGMARSLVNMYRAHGLEWQVVHSTKHREETKLAHWGMVAKGDGRGVLRVTAFGAQFIRGQVRVPSHCDEYDGKRLNLNGNMVSISDVLREPFDYDELMRERPESDPW